MQETNAKMQESFDEPTKDSKRNFGLIFSETVGEIIRILYQNKNLWLTRPPSKTLGKIRDVLKIFHTCSQQQNVDQGLKILYLNFIEGRLKGDDYKTVLKYSTVFSSKYSFELFEKDRMKLAKCYLIILDMLKEFSVIDNMIETLSSDLQMEDCNDEVYGYNLNKDDNC
jgi:hypothetical protein